MEVQIYCTPALKVLTWESYRFHWKAKTFYHNISYEHFGIWPLLGIFEKKHRNARGFAQEFLPFGKCYGPGTSVIRHGTSSSLRSKKKFWLGMPIFNEWRRKWRTFRPPSPGPGRQPLDGSISLKCLLDSRLQSESLDDLLGFRVQKLWSKF